MKGTEPVEAARCLRAERESEHPGCKKQGKNCREAVLQLGEARLTHKGSWFARSRALMSAPFEISRRPIYAVAVSCDVSGRQTRIAGSRSCQRTFTCPFDAA